ncbi:MAG: heme exporter protein CcmD [Maricaulaceae bacterium]
MSDFFAMGGHGPFIWTAYGLSALVLITASVVTLRAAARAKRERARLDALEEPKR